MEPGKVKILQSDAPYVKDPLALFAKLTDYGKRKQTLLLESAEIDTKKNLKSLLLLDAAIEIRCHKQTVTVRACSDNGRAIIPFLIEEMPDEVEMYISFDGIKLVFPKPKVELDEEKRLQILTPFQVLRNIISKFKSLSAERNAIFLGGIFAYDMIETFETLPAVEQGNNPCPDMLFYLAETLLEVDHMKRQSRLTCAIFDDTEIGKHIEQANKRIMRTVRAIQQHNVLTATTADVDIDNDVSVNIPDQEFCQIVEKLKKNVINGDVFQVVPSRCFSMDCPDSFLAYKYLKQLNPSPFMFYLNDPDFVLFGASPESAVHYDADFRQLTLYPIAGTRKRGKRQNGEIDPDLDSRIELELRSDKKEIAEHLMLVDLARNDLARICESGSRHVANLLKVDRYSHVMHLVSRVVGILRNDLDALHAYQACMNMGTLVGAPKLRAAELIRQVETTRRGSYGGAIGYINGHGDMDTCIVIRSACVVNGVAYIQAGAGIVYDSDPQSEADETRNKAQAVIKAIQMANSELSTLMAAEDNEQVIM